jgi:hypothetical protein
MVLPRNYREWAQMHRGETVSPGDIHDVPNVDTTKISPGVPMCVHCGKEVHLRLGEAQVKDFHATNTGNEEYVEEIICKECRTKHRAQPEGTNDMEVPAPPVTAPEPPPMPPTPAPSIPGTNAPTVDFTQLMGLLTGLVNDVAELKKQRILSTPNSQ